MNSYQSDKPVRPNQLLGVILIIAGSLFLLGQFFGFNLWRVAWPFFVVIPGILFIVLGLAIGKDGTVFTVVGAMATMCGVVLGYQNTTNHWTSWSYLWSLIAPTAVGLGLMLHGYWTQQPKMLDSGRRVVMVGLVITAIGWAFFETMIGIGGFTNSAVVKLVGPLLIIGIGVYLIWQRSKISAS